MWFYALGVLLQVVAWALGLLTPQSQLWVSLALGVGLIILSYVPLSRLSLGLVLVGAVAMPIRSMAASADFSLVPLVWKIVMISLWAVIIAQVSYLRLRPRHEEPESWVDATRWHKGTLLFVTGTCCVAMGIFSIPSTILLCAMGVSAFTYVLQAKREADETEAFLAS